MKNITSGRKPLGNKAMTGAERKKKYRLKRKEWLKKNKMVAREVPIKRDLLDTLKTVGLLCDIRHQAKVSHTLVSEEEPSAFNLELLLMDAFELGVSISIKHMAMSLDEGQSEKIVSNMIKELVSENISKIPKSVFADFEETESE